MSELAGTRVPVVIRVAGEWREPVMGRFVLLEDMTVTNVTTVVFPPKYRGLCDAVGVLRPTRGTIMGRVSQPLVLDRTRSAAFAPGAIIIDINRTVDAPVAAD